jgi:hypothetical protein
MPPMPEMPLVSLIDFKNEDRQINEEEKDNGDE